MILLIVLVVVVLFFVLLGYLILFSPHSGNFPFLHIGVSPGFSEKEIPDLSGKVFIVTGGNSGLGFETACHLANANGHVIVTCRDQKKCDETVKAINQRTNGKGKVEASILVLSPLRAVKKWVKDIKPTLKRLDGLILNAGIVLTQFELSEDEIEIQFAVNHLAHFVITTGLLEVLEKTRNSRVVSVSSGSHMFTVPKGVYLTKEEINNKNNYGFLAGYGQSKLANVLFTKELSRRVKNKNIYVNVLHPGAVKTNVFRYTIVDIERKFGRFFVKLFEKFQNLILWSAREASLTIVFLASSQKVVDESIHGEYFIPIGRKSFSSKFASNENLQKKLWEFSEKLVNEAN